MKVHVQARTAIASVRTSVNGKHYRAMRAARRGNYRASVGVNGVPGENIRNTLEIKVTTAGRRPSVKVKSAAIVVSLP